MKQYLVVVPREELRLVLAKNIEDALDVAEAGPYTLLDTRTHHDMADVHEYTEDTARDLGLE